MDTCPAAFLRPTERPNPRRKPNARDNGIRSPCGTCVSSARTTRTLPSAHIHSTRTAAFHMVPRDGPLSPGVLTVGDLRLSASQPRGPTPPNPPGPAARGHGRAEGRPRPGPGLTFTTTAPRPRPPVGTPPPSRTPRPGAAARHPPPPHGGSVTSAVSAGRPRERSPCLTAPRS